MITVADARATVGLGTDATSDRILEKLIAAASATLSRDLNRYVGTPALRTQVLCGGHPPGHDTLFLDDDPIVDDDHFIDVSYRTSPFSAYVAYDDDQWFADGRTLHARSNFYPGRGAIRVRYWAGYEPGAGPAELQDLVRQLVAKRWAAHGSTTDPNMISESLGDYSYTRGDVAAVDGYRETVDRWRRRVV